MKIKLAMLDSDVNYLDRISSVFMNRFSNKLEIHSFTDAEVALRNLSPQRINVFIASEAFEIDIAGLPKHCGFACFVESAGVETLRERPAICKYQKVEMIYKAIVAIYCDNVDEAVGLKFDSDSNVQIVTFVSASGGVGSSCAAAACARSFAAGGKKTLYLNLEQFGSTEPFFSGAGQTDLGDVIFALKSQKSNLLLKLESNVRQDASGVFFYASVQNALHMSELKTDEIQKLMTDLKLMGSYDQLVFDIDFSFHPSAMEILRQSTAIVFVSDGSEISNIKFERAYKTLEIMDENADFPLIPRLAIFYNKFSAKTSKAPDNGVRNIGGAPRFEHATTQQVISQLAGMAVFEAI